MEIPADRLPTQAHRRLAPIYLIGGDEPLLIHEAVAAVRDAARAAGYGEREVHTVESGFNWDELYAATRALSLFTSRRLIELHLPTSKPGDKGGTTLAQIAAESSAETVFLIRAGKLDKSTRATRWAKAIDAVGVVAVAYPVGAQNMLAWVRARLHSRGVKAEAGVAELLAHHMEGNLLACAQEIDKLALTAGGEPVSIEVVERAAGDDARFDVFGFVDTCLAGDAAELARALKGLRAEGVEPVLILWALAREARVIARLATRMAGGEAPARALEGAGVWPRRRALVGRALSRLTADAWLDVLVRAGHVDRMIKGRAAGNPWQGLEELGFALGGINAAPQDPIRVSQ